MCGIVGLYGMRHGPEAREALLRRMTATLSHRGPDGRGVALFRNGGFGHARLAIVGLQDGAQPMAIADPEVAITFNGEIFNHIELRAEVVARGRTVRTQTDTEVILHLYALDGLDFVHRLNGDFALGLYDERARRLVLARDRMGVRPLFHGIRDGTLHFASEVKALLAAPGFEARLDPIALDQIFTLWAPLAPRTPFDGIDELPPGHMLVADPTGIRVKRWWDLDFPDADADAARAEPEYRARAVDAVRATLDDAVAIRLRADVPVGAYLSGGLDSAIVAASAARRVGAGLRTFSVGFESAEHDESAEQAVMVAALGSAHSAMRVADGDIAAIFPAVVRHTERPMLRTGPAPLQMLSRFVRESGYKVVLTGEGADEIFAGYDLFKENAVRRFCARDPGSTRRAALFRRLYPYLPGLRRQSAESLAAFFGVGVDDPADPLFSHRPRLRGTSAIKMFYSADLRRELDGYDACAEMAAMLPERFARWHPLHKAQYLETRFLLPGYILSSQGDRVSMANGVEGRFPFLDHRLVTLAAGLPPGLKLRALEEKHVLRRAAADLVPEPILGRPKQPYRAPDGTCFFAASAPEAVAAALSPEAVRADGLFNPAGVERLAAKFVGGSPPGGFRDNAALVGILSTRLWQAEFARPQVRSLASGHG